MFNILLIVKMLFLHLNAMNTHDLLTFNSGYLAAVGLSLKTHDYCIQQYYEQQKKPLQQNLDMVPGKNEYQLSDVQKSYIKSKLEQLNNQYERTMKIVAIGHFIGATVVALPVFSICIYRFCKGTGAFYRWMFPTPQERAARIAIDEQARKASRAIRADLSLIDCLVKCENAGLGPDGMPSTCQKEAAEFLLACGAQAFEEKQSIVASLRKFKTS